MISLSLKSGSVSDEEFTKEALILSNISKNVFPQTIICS